MKKMTPKQFINSPAGKLVLLVLFVIICWVVLLFYLSANSPGGTWFPKDADMNRLMKDIETSRKKYTEESAKYQKLQELRERYNSQLETYWQVERDGEPESELRTKLSDIATKLEITMTRVDNVRITSKISEELAYADLSFQFSSTYEKIVAFIAEIESTSPRLGWRSFTINLENNRARALANQTASTSSTATTEGQHYRVDATIRVVRYLPTTTSEKKAGENAARQNADVQGANAKPATTGDKVTPVQPPAQTQNAANPALQQTQGKEPAAEMKQPQAQTTNAANPALQQTQGKESAAEVKQPQAQTTNTANANLNTQRTQPKND